MRRVVGIAFLLFQLGMVGYARLVPTRWLCWAPNDYCVRYRLEVRIGGRPLTVGEIFERYQILSQGWYENPPENIMDLVQLREADSANAGAQVALHYRLNGSEEKQWNWPSK